MHIAFLNHAFERLTGYSSEEVSGRDIGFLFGSSANSDAIAKLRKAVELGRSASVTVHCSRKDGSRFWNEISVSPIYEDSRYVGCVTSHNDATAKLLAYAD